MQVGYTRVRSTLEMQSVRELESLYMDETSIHVDQGLLSLNSNNKISQTGICGYE